MSVSEHASAQLREQYLESVGKAALAHEAAVRHALTLEDRTTDEYAQAVTAILRAGTLLDIELRRALGVSVSVDALCALPGMSPAYVDEIRRQDTPGQMWYVEEPAE